MKKFPVVSPMTGLEYLVKITHRRSYLFEEDMYIVEIYRKAQFFRWTYNERLNTDSFYDNWYYGDKWNYDLVAMSLAEIDKYEVEISRTKVLDSRRAKGEKAFMEWDGVTIPEEETE